jgi:p-hydroxybenzoate 3-monooxygenase
MTSMLHTVPDASAFDRMRQLGELYTVVESEAGRRYLAEAYTGWPLPE